ncbi:MAG: phosphoribosylanthranilate isomerase [Rhodocyclaceae bacterium]|nr:phosphoribosylanthranilate isomerase [Rhodocyclaceae bacterium]MCL4679741.1 phosphoribosylanthranilate isomerase [Rhodocyclaceae bacterium]
MAVSSRLSLRWSSSLNSRTRIKVCGITRPEDARAAVEFGADALGLVFYAPSPRCVTVEQAWEIARIVPPFITLVGLFVNETKLTVRRVMEAVPIQLLQFHGDEEESFCRSFHAPYIKAARVRPGLDLVKYAESYPSAQGLLLDAYVEGYGGGGKPFDWSLIPPGLPLPLILSGGLDADNVTEAVRRVRPWAVDVSSGVEAAKGIKDAGKIAAFIAGVKHADV